jgi:hypothetical protein
MALSLVKKELNEDILYYNEDALIKKFETPNSFNLQEKKTMKQKTMTKMKSLTGMAKKMYNSKTNWSSMIKLEDNDIRNDVM